MGGGGRLAEWALGVEGFLLFFSILRWARFDPPSGLLPVLTLISRVVRLE